MRKNTDAEIMARIYANRKELGLCIICCEPRENIEPALCNACTVKNRITTHEKQQQNIKNKVCTICGKETGFCDNGKPSRYCQHHYNLISVKRREQWRKKHNE